ncbi:MAG: DNA mismatch repair endonuclease MutL [Ruminococcaceae bacterium]|nr:DNA mismatch repair endonuclease MutL [Oscillospiraceae bacterium]
MAYIKVLSSQISNMIAAGEVLERPSSAVKELVENSIDAGADRIIVEIENGGKTMIKVTDNGCGMSEDDARTCFLRHATSKISKEEDLEKIATLGFRGEALASIAAVSEVTLETRTKDSIAGTKVVIRAGEIIEVSDTGCNIGTIITIKDLFFNTPVRMKFLKSDQTEAAYITEIMEKLILAKPEISFLLIKNNKEVLYSAGDNNEFSNLLNIYSKDICDNLIKINYEKDYIKIKGYVGNEKILRNNRKNQVFFVNGRVVKNKIFYSAVDEALKEKVMVSKYPFIILDININPEYVDVNVHPTKAEIKFSNDREIYNHIYSAVSSSHKVEGMEVKSTSSFETEEELNNEKYESFSFIKPTEFKEERPKKFSLNLNKKEYNNEFNAVDTPKFEALTPKFRAPEVPYISVKDDAVKSDDFTEENEQKVEDYKIIGQIFSTFVIIEKDDKMYLLDQHAAHERLIFDKLKKEFENKEIISQKLLIPKIIKLSPAEYILVSENKEVFEGLGFDMSEFSESEFAVREIPFELSIEQISDTILEICDIIKENKTSLITYKQEKALETLACKSAIKANMNFSDFELKKLVADVLYLQDANTCPHGRPLFVSYEKSELEKQFKRIT